MWQRTYGGAFHLPLQRSPSPVLPLQEGGVVLGQHGNSHGKAQPHTVHKPLSLMCSFSTMLASWARCSMSTATVPTGCRSVAAAGFTGRPFRSAVR